MENNEHANSQLLLINFLLVISWKRRISVSEMYSKSSANRIWAFEKRGF